MQGGFEARGGWVQSKLQVKPVPGEPPGRPAAPHHAQHRSWLRTLCLVHPGAPAPLPRCAPARLPTAPRRAPLPPSLAPAPAGAIGASSNGLSGTIARTMSTRKSLPAPKA